MFTSTSSLQIRKLLLAGICYFFFSIFFSNISIGQTDFTPQQKEAAFKSIAKYTAGVSDKTDQLLKKNNYSPPSYLAKEWKQYPAVRKIQMAYEAAENAQKGKGGKKFLSLLSQDLARRYDGAKYENSLKGMINSTIETEPLKFEHPKNYGKTKLPGQVKSQILDITKYTEKGALGGTRGVLKYKMGLSDNEVFDILSKSNSSTEALEKGLERAPNPPSPERRIKNIGKELQTKYEGARKDPALNKITDKDYSKKKAPKKLSSNFIDKNKTANRPNPQSTTRTSQKYKSFVKKNYSASGAKKFRVMRGKVKGFGGVVFGNEVIDNTKLPVLDFIRFIPEEVGENSSPTGMLEFVFTNGEVLLESSVRVEDIIAANNIIFGQEFVYETGDGIGLAGVDNSIIYPDSSVRWEAIIHPEIAYSELGWAALFLDVLPIASEEMLNQIEASGDDGNYILALFWSKLATPSTWKITDVPLEVLKNENQLFFKRADIPDSSIVADVFITMQGFRSGEDSIVSEEETIFYEIAPSMIKTIDEVERMNEFARVLAMFRWAKEKEGYLINPPEYGNLGDVPTPESVFISNEKKIEYYSLPEEKELFNKLIQQEVIDFQEQSDPKYDSSKVSLLNQNFVDKLDEYQSTLDMSWELFNSSNPSEVISCRDTFLSPSVALERTALHSGIEQADTLVHLDSLTFQQENLSSDLFQIELKRIYVILLADSFLTETNPEDLKKLRTLQREMEKGLAGTEDEEEIYSIKENYIIATEELIAEASFEFQLMLIYIEVLEEELEDIQNEISELMPVVNGYEPWKETYDNILKVLNTEIEVLKLIKQRYCPEE